MFYLEIVCVWANRADWKQPKKMADSDAAEAR